MARLILTSPFLDDVARLRTWSRLSTPSEVSCRYPQRSRPRHPLCLPDAYASELVALRMPRDGVLEGRPVSQKSNLLDFWGRADQTEGLSELRFRPSWTTIPVPENLRGTAVATCSQLGAIS